jgi:hypothetical protein
VAFTLDSSRELSHSLSSLMNFFKQLFFGLNALMPKSSSLPDSTVSSSDDMSRERVSFKISGGLRSTLTKGDELTLLEVSALEEFESFKVVLRKVESLILLSFSDVSDFSLSKLMLNKRK